MFGDVALTGAQAYEALNFVDGKRSVSDVRDWLNAEFAAPVGTITLADVAAYLEALEKIGVIQL